MHNQPPHSSSPPAEIWLPVVDYEGLYEVSDLGRVRSVDHVVTSGNRWGPFQKFYPGRIRKQRIGAHDYLQIWLSRNGKLKLWYVHRLVGEAFLGPLPPGLETRHGPGGKLDNRLANLCYGTRLQNAGDKVRDGTNVNPGALKGERHHAAKLTEVIVAECRERFANGETQTTLAREFGVTQAAMHAVVRGKNWRHSAPAQTAQASSMTAPGKSAGP